MAHMRKYYTSKKEARYRAEVSVHGTKPRSKSFSRLTDAKIWAREEEAKLQRLGAGIRDHHKHTLAEAVKRYIEEYPQDQVCIRDVTYHLKRWELELGDRYLQTIRPHELVTIRNKIAREPKLKTQRGGKMQPLFNKDGTPKLRKPKTVQAYLDTLGALFNRAMLEWEWIDHNPVRSIKKLKHNDERNRFLSDHFHLWPGETEPRHWDDLTDDQKLDAVKKFPRAYELPRLFAALKNQVNVPVVNRNKPMWTYYLCILQLDLGLRLSEATHMVWEENDLINHPVVIVDLGRQVITLKSTKHDTSSRLKPLSKGAMAVLTKLYEERRYDTPLVFPREDGQAPFKFRERITRAIRDASLQNFRWHDLRHTTASYLSMMGAGQREIMEALHHKTMISSQRYQHLSCEHMRGLFNRLSDVMSEEKTEASRFGQMSGV